MRLTDGFYVGELNPVCFVGYGFEVEGVAGLGVVVSFGATTCLHVRYEPGFPWIRRIAAFWGPGGDVEEFDWRCHFGIVGASGVGEKR